jgi:ribonucleoside-diphosphate reductase alpha chain
MKTRHTNVKITEPSGEVIFEKDNIEIPKHWSDRAATIAASKYFHYNENSVLTLVGRIARQIMLWGQEQGYFESEEQAHKFMHSLEEILLDQRAAFNSPVWFNVGVAENDNQVAACQPGWARINTKNKGLLTIQEIVDKDMVGLTLANGQIVLGTKNNGKKEVLRITTKSGLQLDVTPDHRVYKANGWKKEFEPSKQERCFVEARQLQTGDMLLWSNAPSINSGHNYDTSICQEAYLAGWLQSDGFVRQYENTLLILEGISINSDELEALEKAFVRVFPDTYYKIRSCTTNKGFEYQRLRSYGENARTFVENWGLLKKQESMEIPEFLFTTPHLGPVIAYLRAWFQADGYCTTNSSGSTEVGISTISPKVIEGIQLLLQRLGIFSRRGIKEDKRQHHKPMHCLSIHIHSECKKFQELIGFIGQDKQDKLIQSLGQNRDKGQRIEKYRRLTIKKIESLGEHQVYDIQTDTGDYYTNGIRVHNCFIYGIDDNMEDILQHGVREGMTFKSGSGAGVNVSHLRAQGEPLSNRGVASGPLSFMKIWDQVAGSIRSGGKTRRSAKMVIMDVDHPDIEEFIDCKLLEEKKAQTLIENGIPHEEAYATVAFQNANHSIMVTDEFMMAVTKDQDWALVNRGDGKVARTVRARELFERIARVAWATGDPGIQFCDRINKDNPVPSLGDIECSNPCAEHVAINGSACNLASMNLVKYLTGDGRFNTKQLKEDIAIIVTAQDIMIEPADYPTEQSRHVATHTRPLGLGFTNLGAYLMRLGIPYDSQAAREEAAMITMTMTAAAYNMSIKLAQRMGSYIAYADNIERNLELVERLTRNDELVATAKEHGIRNSQLTCLAPTGTISFLMDCDSTGIEPLYALKAYKQLTGGGTIEIEPSCVEVGRVFDNPDVLKTANEITPFDHIKMMADCQKFLNGAISKTVNMPANATVDNVIEAYLYAWEKGLKSIAIYRDGCKAMQPLTAKKDEIEEVTEPNDERWTAYRKKLPETRQSLTHKFNVAGLKGYLTCSTYEEGDLGEIFIRTQKQGTTVQGLMDGMATAVSLGLQYGVPLETFVDKFVGSKFEPAGVTQNEDVRFAQSVMDYIFRWLKLNFMDEDDDETFINEMQMPNSNIVKANISFDGPPCPRCQTITGRAGACYVCPQCGESTGCS